MESTRPQPQDSLVDSMMSTAATATNTAPVSPAEDGSWGTASVASLDSEVSTPESNRMSEYGDLLVFEDDDLNTPLTLRKDQAKRLEHLIPPKIMPKFFQTETDITIACSEALHEVIENLKDQTAVERNHNKQSTLTLQDDLNIVKYHARIQEAAIEDLQQSREGQDMTQLWNQEQMEHYERQIAELSATVEKQVQIHASTSSSASQTMIQLVHQNKNQALDINRLNQRYNIHESAIQKFQADIEEKELNARLEKLISEKIELLTKEFETKMVNNNQGFRDLIVSEGKKIRAGLDTETTKIWEAVSDICIEISELKKDIDASAKADADSWEEIEPLRNGLHGLVTKVEEINVSLTDIGGAVGDISAEVSGHDAELDNLTQGQKKLIMRVNEIKTELLEGAVCNLKSRVDSKIWDEEEGPISKLTDRVVSAEVEILNMNRTTSKHENIISGIENAINCKETGLQATRNLVLVNQDILTTEYPQVREELRGNIQVVRAMKEYLTHINNRTGEQADAISEIDGHLENHQKLHDKMAARVNTLEAKLAPKVFDFGRSNMAKTIRDLADRVSSLERSSEFKSTRSVEMPSKEDEEAPVDVRCTLNDHPEIIEKMASSLNDVSQDIEALTRLLEDFEVGHENDTRYIYEKLDTLENRHTAANNTVSTSFAGAAGPVKASLSNQRYYIPPAPSPLYATQQGSTHMSTSESWKDEIQFRVYRPSKSTSNASTSGHEVPKIAIPPEPYLKQEQAYKRTVKQEGKTVQTPVDPAAFICQFDEVFQAEKKLNNTPAALSDGEEQEEAWVSNISNNEMSITDQGFGHLLKSPILSPLADGTSPIPPVHLPTSFAPGNIDNIYITAGPHADTRVVFPTQPFSAQPSIPKTWNASTPMSIPSLVLPAASSGRPVTYVCPPVAEQRYLDMQDMLSHGNVAQFHAEVQKLHDEGMKSYAQWNEEERQRS